MKYEFTTDMREISGFGGGYEMACRSMVVAGLEYLDAHPGEDPQFHGYKGIYGVIEGDNQAAKNLTDAMLKGAGGDCTGAMMQATIGHVLMVRRMGWEAYCAESRRRYAEDPQDH